RAGCDGCPVDRLRRMGAAAGPPGGAMTRADGSMDGEGAHTTPTIECDGDPTTSGLFTDSRTRGALDPGTTERERMVAPAHRRKLQALRTARARRLAIAGASLARAEATE